VDQVFAVLDAIPSELASSGKQPNSMFVHELEETLDQLGALEHIPSIELARREYALFPLFAYRQRSLTLHRVLAESPELFVSILSDVFRPKSGESREPSDEERARAQIGYRILSSFRILPGRRDNDIDGAAVHEWVRQVRRLAAGADRTAIADEYIGHLVAHAPSDPEDQAWPHRIIRDLIEEVRSDSLELGVRVERHNMRGTVSKAMFEGGAQERALADEARRWARAAAGWPRTQAMLLSLARSWDDMAAREDERARQDAMRYE
jgi:hypothetical protein